MTTPAGPPPKLSVLPYRTFDHALLVLTCLAALYGRLSYLFEPFGTDGAMFIYMGKTVAHGGRVGVDIIDNKFPTVGLMISLPWTIFGDYWPGYVALQTALMVLGALLLGRGVGRALGQRSAIATTLAAMVFLNLSVAVGGGFQLETFQAFFTLVAASSALSALREDDPRDAFVVGLAAGVAMTFKPSAIAILLAFTVATFIARRADSRRTARRVVVHAASVVLGLLIPASFTLLYLVRTDLLAELPNIWTQISLYASQSRLEVWDLGKWCAVLVAGGTPLLIRAVVYRRHTAQQTGAPTTAIWCFALAWIALEAVGVAAQRRMYPYHFLVLAPPAALCFGLLPRRESIPALVASLLLPLLLSQYGAWCWFTRYQPPTQRLAISDYLAARAAPGDRVWQDYMMRLMVETNLQPGSRFPVTFIWANDVNAPVRFSRPLLADFDEKKPRFIVLPADTQHYIRIMTSQIRELESDDARRQNYLAAWDALLAKVHRDYAPTRQIGRDTVWERRSPGEGFRVQGSEVSDEHSGVSSQDSSVRKLQASAEP